MRKRPMGSTGRYASVLLRGALYSGPSHAPPRHCAIWVGPFVCAPMGAEEEFFV